MSVLYKAYKYRIYPTAEQQKQIETNMSICRYVYNVGLEIKKTAWKSAGIYISAFNLQKQYTEAKKEFPWLGNACRSAVEEKLKDVGDAFERFFKGAGYPKFKSKKDRQSFTIRKARKNLDFEKQLLTISHLKNIPIVVSRRFTGEIKRVTISRTNSGKYMASVLVKCLENKPEKCAILPKSTVGIDLGIKSFVVTSDGKSFLPNRKFRDSLNRLKLLQRRESKKKRGSKNRNKANQKIVLLYEKITNQRADYIHKITTELVRDNQADTFVIEDLNVSGMLKNCRLSQAISDVSFYEFSRQMQYKCDWYGKNLITIGRFDPSSKRCSCCGEIKADLTLSDREWTCDCGAHHDRDINAAINIKHFGLEKYSRQDMPGEPVELPSLEGTEKQEVAFARKHRVKRRAKIDVS